MSLYSDAGRSACPPPPGGGPADFVRGAFLPLKAAVMLAGRPRWWPLVAIPLIANILLLVGLIAWGYGPFAEWAGKLPADGWYWVALGWVVRTLFWLAAAVAAFLIFTPLALIVAAPFNDLLAERTEHAMGFGLSQAGPWVPRLLADALFAIGAECRRLLICGGVFLLLVPLNLLPVVGQVLYVALGFYWASRCAGLEFISYAADRRRLPWGDKWTLLRRHWALTLGFGVATVLLLTVPFVNVLAVPVSAVGGTLLFGILRTRQGLGH